MTSDLRRIIAIGGGEIGGPMKDGSGYYPVETGAIDKEIHRLTNKTSPSLLFIPTASNDSQQYLDTVRKHFLEIGFGSVDALLLSDASLTTERIRDAILSHDAIYVGGGNTQKMMMIWRELGVDSILKEALDQGVVLSGISAGSICWFSQGISDSERTVNDEKKLIEVDGLGFIDAVHCPHYDQEPHRQSEVKQRMSNSTKVAICLDDCTAIQIVGDEYRVIKTKPNAQAHKAYWKHGEYIVEEIAVSDTPKSLSSLLVK